MSDKEIRKKHWSVRTKDGINVHFEPVFMLNDRMKDDANLLPGVEEKEIECKFVNVWYTDKKGETVMQTFNFLDLFTFVYFCANEELRRQLALRYERKVSMIPYDVSFKLSQEECKTAHAKRRIELPVDEIAMAIARNDSWKYKLGLGLPKK